MRTHIHLARSSPGPVEADRYSGEAAPLIRDARRPGRHEKRDYHQTGGRADCPDERVIWSPFRLQSRKRGAAVAPLSSGSARRDGAHRALVLLLCLSLLPAVATAQSAVAEAPVNSHAKSYGDGWECDWGYRTVAQACEPIIVPAHAYLDAFGGRWDCDRGYRDINEACVPIEVPLHAFLNSSGHSWQCDRGYQRDNGSCIAVVVPADAYLGSAGDRWECERGFRRNGASCVALVVPPNAHIGYSDNAWMCHPGYRQRGDTCIEDER